MQPYIFQQLKFLEELTGVHNSWTTTDVVLCNKYYKDRYFLSVNKSKYENENYNMYVDLPILYGSQY